MKREILELKGECKDNLWGGNRLREEYGKTSDSDIIAESWELAARKDGKSTILNGEYKGKSLAEYIDINGIEVLGKKCEKFGNLPVLVKLIDAKNDLSIQVHPSDEYAYEHEGEAGKTEVWYIIDCDENAQLVYGFKEEITKEEFEKSIKDNSFLDKLNFVKVKKGDIFFIPSGTLHAIGAGILIAEIQQNSNLTYRVYDYNRKDKDGNTRELHVAKALEVTNLKPSAKQKTYETVKSNNKSIIKIASCEYFTAEKIDTESEAEFETDEESFHHLMCINGEGILKGNNGEIFNIKKGTGLFVPAGYGKYTVSGKTELIFTAMNDIK